MRRETLIGAGASAGRATGTARVITGPDDLPRVAAGDIVVAEAPGLALAPLLDAVAGLISSEGGVLCTVATLARERSLPAVVAVPAATQRIADGDRVEVDGGAGTVTILHAA